ncbi:uncharacterized protein LOC101460222 [Ceratitis capitata]|uniref:(Mediterranean fruit fly) hypothetical protein n=1 Tax=Ceratitis capitata TaxID=7213 RepID=W8C4X8_CERCA|nr:uncharacterized protein LOC101460222 [Ceratitis capitata]XP_023158407.1 uncharacterized protein LOC101460222 [Ceratitis capitata]CAD6993323.1 unnamed protein product [Ceratitis capitata]
MHQVLSYETAVRANSSREYREYVTKRTCVSLVLTIAFLTLILGYLLGNFVSERKYQMRLNKEAGKGGSGGGGAAGLPHTVDVSSADYENLKEINTYQKNKAKLLSSAQALTKMLQRDQSSPANSINSVIFNKYISCTQDIPPNTSMESSKFIEQLVDNAAAIQKDCLRVIQLVIDDKMTGGTN